MTRTLAHPSWSTTMTTKTPPAPWMVQAWPASPHPPRRYLCPTREEALAKIEALKDDHDIDFVWSGVQLHHADHHHMTYCIGGWRRSGDRPEHFRGDRPESRSMVCSQRLADLLTKHRTWDRARTTPATETTPGVSPAYHGPRAPTWRAYLERERAVMASAPEVPRVVETPLQIEVM